MTVVVIEGMASLEVNNVYLFPDRATAKQVIPDAVCEESIDYGDPMPKHVMVDVERSTQRHVLQLLEHLSQS